MEFARDFIKQNGLSYRFSGGYKDKDIQSPKMTQTCIPTCNATFTDKHTKKGNKRETCITYIAYSSYFSPFDIIKKKRGGKEYKKECPEAHSPFLRITFTVEGEMDGKIAVGSEYPGAWSIESLVGP